jgi:hypothetical protein
MLMWRDYRAIAGFEVHQIPTSLVKKDPDNKLMLLPLMVVALVSLTYYFIELLFPLRLPQRLRLMSSFTR